MSQLSHDKNLCNLYGMFCLIYHIILILHAQAITYSARYKTISTIIFNSELICGRLQFYRTAVEIFQVVIFDDLNYMAIANLANKSD